MNSKSKRILVVVLTAIVALSAVAAVVFGLELHLKGREFNVKYELCFPGDLDKVEIDATSQKVVYGESYRLKVPKSYDPEVEFLYWTIKGTNTVVTTSGVWKYGKDVVLEARWTDEVYSDNY